MIYKKVLFLQIICSVMLFFQVLCRNVIPFHLVGCLLAILILLIRRRHCRFDFGYNIYIILLYIYRLFLIFYPLKHLLLWLCYYALILGIAICNIIISIKIYFRC